MCFYSFSTYSLFIISPNFGGDSNYSHNPSTSNSTMTNDDLFYGVDDIGGGVYSQNRQYQSAWELSLRCCLATFLPLLESRL